MLVMLDGIVTDVSPAHPSNANSQMLVTLDGIVTVPFFPPGQQINSDFVLL